MSFQQERQRAFDPLFQEGRASIRFKLPGRAPLSSPTEAATIKCETPTTTTAAHERVSSGLPHQPRKQSAGLNFQPILPLESAPPSTMQPGLMNCPDSQSREIVAAANAMRHESHESSTKIRDKRFLQLDALEKSIQSREQIITSREEAVKARQIIIAERDAMALETERRFAERDVMCLERERKFVERDVMVSERERRAFEMDSKVTRREDIVKSREDAVKLLKVDLTRAINDKENSKSRCPVLEEELRAARNTVASLEGENDNLLQEKKVWQSEQASFGKERSGWLLEKEEWNKERARWIARDASWKRERTWFDEERVNWLQEREKQEQKLQLADRFQQQYKDLETKYVADISPMRHKIPRIFSFAEESTKTCPSPAFSSSPRQEQAPPVEIPHIPCSVWSGSVNGQVQVSPLGILSVEMATVFNAFIGRLVKSSHWDITKSLKPNKEGKIMCLVQRVRREAAEVIVRSDGKDWSACSFCIKTRKPCVFVTQTHGAVLVPLPEQQRGASSVGDVGFYVLA